MATKTKESAYKKAGVDIDLATRLLKKVKKTLAKARRPEMLAPIGGFGGLFELDLSKYSKPVLVGSVDGVGTKLMVARRMGMYEGLGHDIVNHCVNDIAVQGAEPLFFLDYFGCGKLTSPEYETVLCGVAEACAANGCALLGGETAEMPGMYGEEFDLVGSITGVVEKDKLITGERVKPGHVAIGLPSSGLHTNGFSLARRVLFDSVRFEPADELDELGGESIGETLLQPHISYWKAIKAAMDAGLGLHGIAHITGGGVYDNVPRILPPKVSLHFQRGALPVPPIFTLIEQTGDVDWKEMHRVFNMGVGMIWLVPKSEADAAIAICRSQGHDAAVCGEIVKGAGDVVIE